MSWWQRFGAWGVGIEAEMGRATDMPPGSAPMIVGVKPRQRRAATPKTGTPATRDGAVLCPTCKDWFVSAEVLEAHRATRHGYRAGQATESFLCSRCPEAFPTRTERDEHQATHPAEPVDRLVGRDPHATRHAPAGVQIA